MQLHIATRINQLSRYLVVVGSVYRFCTSLRTNHSLAMFRFRAVPRVRYPSFVGNFPSTSCCAAINPRLLQSDNNCCHAPSHLAAIFTHGKIRNCFTEGTEQRHQQQACTCQAARATDSVRNKFQYPLHLKLLQVQRSSFGHTLHKSK